MTGSEAVAGKNRFNIILSLALIWAGLLSVRLFYFSVVKRADTFGKMETESLEKGRIRAMRGRILTADGEVLAYTKRTTSLFLKTSVSAHQLNGLVEILEKEMKLPRRKILMKLANAENLDSVELMSEVSPEMISTFSRYFGKNSALFLKMGFSRVYNSSSRKLGETNTEDGQLVGVSGFEKKYDEVLTGSDLVYEVMVDRRNKVIEKTYKEVSKMVPGQDIHLSEEEWR